MLQSNYQKVSVDGASRPLLYILWDPSHLKWYFDNDTANFKTAMEYLRQQLATRGVGAPYIVVLDGLAGASLARDIGADAISNYISAFKGGNGTGPFPYTDLDQQTRKFWKAMADTGVPTIPIAMVGWDNRARQERPPPREHKVPNPNPTRYFTLATPTELSAHLQAAVDFIETNKKSCVSKALLIYSWDECDEGGGIIPTMGDPAGSYISAMRPVLSKR